MSEAAETSKLESAKASLQRVQDFEPAKLGRQEELGASFSFERAIDPARRVISIFRKIPLEGMETLPETELDRIQQQSDSFYNLLQDIMDYDPANQENPSSVRDSLINKIINSYPSCFLSLYHLISYLASQLSDFTSIQTEGRATIQSIRDDTEKIRNDLENARADAESVLEEIRKTAAEQGVSQQASYFKEASDEHKKSADNWKIGTIVTACFLVSFAIFSLFLHKISYFDPGGDPYAALQLVASKILIFGVIGYMLVLAARNFLSHMHNSIINKHRQNALMTFKSLVDAAQIDEKQDIVLAHAAQSIYAPQDTGYSRGSVNSTGQKVDSLSIVRSLPIATARGGGDN